MKPFVLGLGVTVLLVGCTPMTQFEGSARVENGRAGCERKCASQGLQFAGMVFVGEYSDACLCQVPAAAGGVPQATSAASTAPAVAAVVTAQRIAEEQRRQQQHQAHYVK
jgi:hypothetical protein